MCKQHHLHERIHLRHCPRVDLLKLFATTTRAWVNKRAYIATDDGGYVGVVIKRINMCLPLTMIHMMKLRIVALK